MRGVEGVEGVPAERCYWHLLLHPPANFDPGDPRFDATDCPETACHARHLKEQYKLCGRLYKHSYIFIIYIYIYMYMYIHTQRQEYLGAQSQDV